MIPTRKITKEGLLLCELQATAFEKSAEMMASSSEIFIRRYMRSAAAKSLDNESILQTNHQANDLLMSINEE